MFLPVFHDSTEVEGLIGGDSPIGASFLTKTRARDALYYLDQMEKILNVSVDSPAEFRQGLSQFMIDFTAELESSGVLARTDRALTYNLMPAIEAYGESFIKRNEINNLAKLTMAARRFHRQFDRWPSSLDELSKISVNAKTFTPVAPQPFGFWVEDNGDALLWGVDRSDLNPIPQDPPPTDGVENERNAPWVWRLLP